MPIEMPGLTALQKGKTLKALDDLLPVEDSDEIAAKKAFKVLAQILLKA